MNDASRNEPRELRSVTRRTFLARTGAAGLGAAAIAALAGCGGGGDDGPVPIAFAPGTNPNDIIAPPPAQPNPPARPITDADVLNFALNLEYLEAEYYMRAVTGRGLDAADIGSGAGAVTGGRQVNFSTPVIRDFAVEIAADEVAHVRFLRQALGGAAVARPPIDLQASFNSAAQAAGIGQSFDPFANETNFLLGAFIFEDLGVTAYKGGATLIQNKALLEAAAGILGVEAYHAGIIRNLIFDAGSTAVNLAQRISDLRDSADGPGDKDQGVVVNGMLNIVPADANGIAFGRNPSEVLSIAYLGANASGGFFPQSVNGMIKAAG